MGITGIFGNISQTKKRSNAKKLSFKLMSALLGCTLFFESDKGFCARNSNKIDG